jgi:proteasome lid subunit RPN8/RPN11
MHQHHDKPHLVVSGFAYYKMRYLANKYNVEVGGWGTSRTQENPLSINDIKLIRQKSTAASIDFDDAGIVEYMEDMVDAGMEFPQFMRVWFHTHPMNSAGPSRTDRETFEQLTGTLPWVVMAIIAKEGQVYAELGTRIAGHHVQWEMKFSVDWAFHNWAEWDKEYDDNVVDTFPRPTYSIPDPRAERPGWVKTTHGYRYVGEGATQAAQRSDPPKLGKAKRKTVPSSRLGGEPVGGGGKRARKRRRRREKLLIASKEEIHGGDLSEKDAANISESVIRSAAILKAESPDLPNLFDPDQPHPGEVMPS